MGKRRRESAIARKEARKTQYIAKLMDNPTSPRKTRLMADAIRGVEIEKALGILQFSHRESAPKLRKLLLSAIANWQVKNEGKRVEESGLYVKRITVDGGRQLKRLRTAPQDADTESRKDQIILLLSWEARLKKMQCLQNQLMLRSNNL